MTQLGITLGGSSFLGTTILESARGKQDTINTMAAGAVGCASSWRSVAWSSISAAAMRLGAP